MMIEAQGAVARQRVQDHVVVSVSDDPDVLAVLRRFLVPLPCQTHVVKRPGEVFDLLASHRVSMVIADQQMKRASGHEILEEVARMSPLTARVLLAAYPESHDIIEASAETVHGIIGKPWDGHALQRTILAILQWQEGRTAIT